MTVSQLSEDEAVTVVDGIDAVVAGMAGEVDGFTAVMATSGVPVSVDDDDGVDDDDDATAAFTAAFTATAAETAVVDFFAPNREE
jgi:hypothetical protein